MKIIPFLLLLSASFCSFIGGKRRIRSSAPLNDDSKKMKLLDPTSIEEMTALMLDHFVLDELLNENSMIIKTCVENEHVDSFKALFSYIESDYFEILFTALKMSISASKPNVFRALAVPEFVKTDHQSAAVLEHVLKLKRFEYLKILLENGFKFENWRSKSNINIAHVIVQNEMIDCIKYIPVDLYEQTNKSGNSPIFYADSVKMIKSFRKRFPGARGQLNKLGRTPWQEALINNRYELANALISMEKRMKIWRSTQLDYYDLPWVKTACLLKIHRASLLFDSFHQTLLNRSKWFQSKPKFFIEYSGETGIDAGGLKIDWISNLLQRFFSTSSELGSVPFFIQVDDETGLYAPNLKYKNPEIFKFAGSIIGLAFAMNIGIKAKFIPAIYKSIFKEKMDLIGDLIEQNPSVYTNLQLLRQPSLKLSDLELTMPSNPAVRVIRRNIGRYIDEYSDEIIYGQYKTQIAKFVEGFEVVQAVNVSNYFTLQEFKTIITGKPGDFTVEEFSDCLTCSCPKHRAAILKFVGEITAKQRELLLKFITGLNSLPINGLAGLDKPIQVKVDNQLTGRLPTSSTCVYSLKVPPFVGYESFSKNLLLSIEWTDSTDNEPGITITADRIILEFDEEPLKQDGNKFVDSESDVSSDEEEEKEEEIVVERAEEKVSNHLLFEGRSRFDAFPEMN